MLEDLSNKSDLGVDENGYLVRPDGSLVLDKNGNPIKASALDHLDSSSDGSRRKGKKKRKGRRKKKKPKKGKTGQPVEPESAFI